MMRSHALTIALALIGLALSTATAVLSASAPHRPYLLALAAALAAVTPLQAIRSLRRDVRHDHEISDLREGQEYLAQPESYRQMHTLFEHHAALRAGRAPPGELRDRLAGVVAGVGCSMLGL
jgi:hypothetical protein